MKQLGFPALFCNEIFTDKKGFVSGYRLRQKEGKAKAVKALQGLNFQVRAVGDSYNDLAMLQAAERGILFNPPPAIRREYPRFPAVKTYPALFKRLTQS
jgi:phosphoserine/homoserine phosphotransferase